MTMAHQKLVSVVIPTYNRAEMLRLCVESVLSNSYKLIEVIIVDDASPDKTQSLIKDAFGAYLNVILLRNEKNMHQAYGRNVGATRATGEYILFLDDDNVIDHDMIKTLVACLELHPKLGMAAPLAIHAQTEKIWTLGSGFNFMTSMPVNLHEGKSLDEVTIDNDIYPTSYSPNAFMVRREAYEAVGGFDPFYGVMFEESDFGLKLIKKGFQCAICPKARTIHHGFLEPGSVAQLRQLGIETAFRAYCFARNRSVFTKRFAPFWGKVSILLVFVPLFAFYYCVIAMKNRRPDIAWAFAKGSFVGLFTPAYQNR